MKKVLIITYYWPPTGGSGVQRWLKFAKYLPENGWEPVIYTPLNPDNNSSDSSLLEDVAPGLKVIKRKIWEPYSFYRALTGKKEIKANMISDTSDSQSFKKKLSMWVRGNFFIPDPRCFWIKTSVKFLCKYLKENRVDAVVSTGPPHSMHLIAQKLCSKLNIPWIADFRDPWTEIFYFKHLNLGARAYNKHRRLEQLVLDTANNVVVVSPKMQHDFEVRTKTPVKVVSNGYDPADFEKIAPAAESLLDNGEPAFVLTHTGIFVDNGNPDNLWEVLGQKSLADKDFARRLRIRLIGQVDDSVMNGIEKNGLGGNTIKMGYQPHLSTISWQKSADVLLLPLRKEPEAAAILTGKFFEYLASGRKILAFGPVEGNLGHALRETASGNIFDFSDKAGIKSAVDELYSSFLKGTLNNKDNDSAHDNNMSEKYSRRTLTLEYSKLLNEIIHK